MRKAAIYTVFLLNLLAIGVVWTHVSLSLLTSGIIGGELISIGNLMGLVAAYLILWQLLIIGRVGWIQDEFGFDKLTRYHHLIGLGVWVLVIIHPILLILGGSVAANTGVVQQFFDYLRIYPDILKAVLGWLMIVGTIFLSINLMRRRLKYELWHLIHLSMYLSIIFVFSHQVHAGNDFVSYPAWQAYWYALYAAVASVLLYWRFWLPFWRTCQNGYEVERVVPEGPLVTSIYITGRQLDKLPQRAGQFAILTFLKPELLLQHHPFSLSKAPDDKSLRFTIKNVGDFTSGIRKLKPGTKVMVQGPYGSFGQDLKPDSKLLFLAGGIGITPLRALAEALAAERDIELIFAAKSEDDLVLRNELEKIKGLKIHYLLEQPASFAQTGRISPEILKQLVPDYKKREVLLCGPPPMMKAVRKLLADQGIDKHLIHYERFALG